MKLKYFTIVLIILFVICSVNALSATSDNDTMVSLDQSGELIPLTDESEFSVDEDNSSETPQEETTNANSDTPEETTSDEPSEPVLTPLEKFTKDLNSGEKTVYLTGNIKIKQAFTIKNNIVIDGQGYSIDGQKKTNIFIVKGSTLTIKNLILKNGKAAKGGAICCSGNLNVDKCTFTSNFATENGGAIFISSGTLKITNSKFNKNKVENSKKTGHGGAVWIYNGNSQISKSTFTSNYCLSKSLKKHSQATKYQFGGGAVYYNQGNSHTLTDCTFSGNKASNMGGAVYVLKSKSLKIKKCTFKNNKVTFEDGGAISFNGKKLVIQNSKFSKNHAYEDGGVMDTFSLTKQKIYITITDSVFDSNLAYKGGGAIWMGVKTVFTFKNDKFTNNQASMGGALFSEDATAKFTKCTFQSNKAKKVTKWTAKNKAGKVLKHCGGVVMIQKRSVTFTKCTFKTNYAVYGGVAFVNGGKLKITGNTFKSNKGKTGSAIYSHKKLSTSDKNKWGIKTLTTSKAMKVKNLVRVA